MCQKEGEADDHTEKNMNEKTVDQLSIVPLQIKYFLPQFSICLKLVNYFKKNHLGHTMYDFAI